MRLHRLVMERVHLFFTKAVGRCMYLKRNERVPLGRRVGNQLVHVGGVVTADQHTGLHVCLLAARSCLAFNVRVFSRVSPSLPPCVTFAYGWIFLTPTRAHRRRRSRGKGDRSQPCYAMAQLHASPAVGRFFLPPLPFFFFRVLNSPKKKTISRPFDVSAIQSLWTKPRPNLCFSSLEILKDCFLLVTCRVRGETISNARVETIG